MKPTALIETADLALQASLRIGSHLQVVPIHGTGIILVTEDGMVLIRNKIAIQILDSLSRQPESKASLFERSSDFGPQLEVFMTISQLQEKGFITDEPAHFPPSESAYWKSLGYKTAKLSGALLGKPLQVLGLGAVQKQAFVEMAEACGFTCSDSPSLRIVLTDDYRHPELEAFHHLANAEKIPWLLVKPNGTSPLVGPLFLPGSSESACWKCLQHRLALNDHQGKFYAATTGAGGAIPRPVVHHPLSEQVVASIVFHALMDWVYHGGEEQLVNKVIEVQPRWGTRELHVLTKRPQCSACGDPWAWRRPMAPVVLDPAERPIDLQGGYRSVSHEATFHRYAHHISPITGILPFVKPYEQSAHSSIHNFTSGRNQALHSNSLFWLNMHLRSSNGGKGKTDLQAKTGALCEGIERYCLMYHDNVYAIRGSLASLTDAIHPNQFMLFSAAQFDARASINEQAAKFYSLIPIPFEEAETMDWTPIYSLSEGRYKYAPTCYCYAQYPAADEQRLYSYPDSNGAAAGNTVGEAILQGFLELVERDAAAIWWYNRLQRPGVDLASAQNPYIDEMIDYYRAMGRSLYVLDLTHDLGIPVFCAVSHDMAADAPDSILYAFGAHLDPHIGLERAIVELNQLLPIAFKKDVKDFLDDSVFVNWLTQVSLASQPYLIPSAELPRDMQTDFVRLGSASIYDSIQHCILSAQLVGLQTLVLDLTQPDIGLPVVKVMVPGLRHMWRRTAPGRLYDVPVKMGWLERPFNEEELNPESIII
jgi:oxazoline/thiazoline synthase